MKVLHIFHGAHVSGAELVAFDFLGHSQRREDHALVINDSPILIRRLQDRLGEQNVFPLGMHVEIHRLHRWLTFSCLARQFWQDSALLIKDGGVEFNTYDAIIYNNTLEAALFSEFHIPDPQICYVHDMIGALRQPVRRAFLKTARRSQHIITVSEAARKEIAVRVNRDRTRSFPPVTVVYNGAIFNPSSQTRTLKLPLSRFVFFGGGQHRKGLDIAIAGLRRVSKISDTNISLCVYGEIAPRLQSELLQSSPPLRLDFRGKAAHEHVFDAMTNADAVLVPSRRDPLPTVVLEALSLGKLVLASNVDGIPEMICEPKFLFQPDDGSSLANCIFSINGLSPGDLASILEHCVRWAEAKFSISSKVGKINEIICDVSNTGKGVSCPRL